MAALVESGVRNLNFGDADSVGFFQMRVGIWNQGEYAGYPDNPGLQAKWFIDTALAVKRQRDRRAATPTSARTRASGASGSPTSSARPSSTAAATSCASPRRAGCCAERSVLAAAGGDRRPAVAAAVARRAASTGSAGVHRGPSACTVVAPGRPASRRVHRRRRRRDGAGRPESSGFGFGFGTFSAGSPAAGRGDRVRPSTPPTSITSAGCDARGRRLGLVAPARAGDAERGGEGDDDDGGDDEELTRLHVGSTFPRPAARCQPAVRGEPSHPY